MFDCKILGRERNFKKGRGGFYDIDFIASTLAIEHELSFPASDIIQRLTILNHAGLLSGDDLAYLCRYAELLRALEHALRVTCGAARNSLPGSQQDLQAIHRLMQRSLSRELPWPPQLLEEMVPGIRAIFERILGV